MFGGTQTSMIKMPKLKAMYTENIDQEDAHIMFSRLCTTHHT